METRNVEYLLNLRDLTVKTKRGAKKEERAPIKALKITLHEQIKEMYLKEKSKISSMSTFNLLCQTEILLGNKLDLGVIESKLQVHVEG